MPRGGPRRVIERQALDVQLRRHTEGSANGDTTHEFAPAESIQASIRPYQASEFDVGVEGQTDATYLYMDVLEKPPDADEQLAREDPAVVHPPVETDDRILYDGRPWQAVQRLPATRNHFARFVLKEDGRGGTDDSSDSSGGDTLPF